MSLRNALVTALALGACRPSGTAPNTDVSHARSHAMQYSATVVASGSTRPRRVPAPLYAVLRTPDAWRAFVEREGLASALSSTPTPILQASPRSGSPVATRADSTAAPP